MLSFALAAITIALAPADPVPCTRQHPPSDVRLQAIVRELHPDALDSAANGATPIVAVVLDSACTVQRHAMTAWSSGTITVDTAIAAMFPGIRAAPFEGAGITLLDGTARGRIVVVWAVAPALAK